MSGNTTTTSTTQRQEVTSIPTSTVVAIGGGFIAFALLVFTLLSFSRSIRIYRQSRRSDPPRSFRQAWRDEGGFWGFFNGMGLGSGQENMMLGMHGGRDLRGWRLWEELRAWEVFEREKNMKRPEMWEVGVSPRGEKGNVENVHSVEDDTHWMPISIITPHVIDEKSQSPPSHDPILSIAVLIQFPSPPNATSKSDPSDEELPDLLIGTTTLLPLITGGTTERMGDDQEKDKLDEEQIEYHETRRAGWTKTSDEKWVIEGL